MSKYIDSLEARLDKTCRDIRMLQQEKQELGEALLECLPCLGGLHGTYNHERRIQQCSCELAELREKAEAALKKAGMLP